MDMSETKNLPKTDHTPAVLDETSRKLLEAASWLEKKGHCQKGAGSLYVGPGCVWAAIVSVHHEENYDLAIERLRRAIGMTSFILWNDTHTTIEVIAKLRAVAFMGKSE